MLSPYDIIVIELSEPEWPRWMVFHRAFNCFWSDGRWWRDWRCGSLWHDEQLANEELDVARQSWQSPLFEDE